jgi:hypothetical protein
MKKFLAVYIGTASALEKFEQRFQDAEKRRQQERAGMEAWGQWVVSNGQSIVDHGAPLGKTKRVSAEGISDIRNNLAAYTIIQAESHEAATRMFAGHPHFAIFPGDSVEIMECLPLPKV